MDNDSFINHFNKEEKQLLLSETGETDLVVREVIGAIVEGAKAREAARKVIPIINTVSDTCRVTYGSSPSGSYASYVAEGASINIDGIQWSKTDIDIKKAAVRIPITNELIEDSEFDVVELELKKAGAKLENKLNQQAITTMLDSVTGTSDVDPNGSHIGTYDIGLAKAAVDSKGWKADSVLLEPNGYGYLMDETNMPEIAAGNNSFLGLNISILDADTDGTGTAMWDGTDSSNHYTGLVFDSYNYAVIAMREDINIGKFKDPVHDLLDVVAKMRFGVGVLNTDAACRILTK